MELESTFYNESVSGVLITGEPGSGKTALMLELVCSETSSSFIHNKIIGYHFCDHSEKSKRDGARFVRNLVDQIAARLPEYSNFVRQNTKHMRQELDEKCQKDPTLCFSNAILDPLQHLQPSQGLKGFRYIAIDAVDECFESDMKTSEIVEILTSKILRFPSWLKIILTSRNLTKVTEEIPHVLKRMPIDPANPLNVDDIRAYVSRFVPQSSHFSDKLLEAVNIKSRSHQINTLIDEVTAKSDGNFLFVKAILQYIKETHDHEQNIQSLPTKLGDFYHMFFKRQFGEDGFDRFRPLFEVLLAVCSPLKLEDYIEILQRKVEYVTKLIQQVSSLLRFEEDGTVRIYHQSFAEWLITQTSKLGIKKTRGHEYIAEFRLKRIFQKDATVTFDELTELSLQVVSAGLLKRHEDAIDLLNITELRDPHTKQCILHHLATLPSVYLPALTFYLKKFENVDILDARRKTPALYAATVGNDEHLKLFIDKGADVNSFQEGFNKELNPVFLIAQTSRIERFSLIHAAAYNGHAKVVELLIKEGTWYSESRQNYPKPLYLAAANGHLDTVEVMYRNGVHMDTIALHHAAAKNQYAVAEFLLGTVGLRDTCLPCNGSNQMDFAQNLTIAQAHEFFCETALHAAVSRGHINIVKLLLRFGYDSLECTHHSGKTVLMDAVERNDTEMVELLLKYGAKFETQCGNRISKNAKWEVCARFYFLEISFLYTIYCVDDSCACGNRAIHLAARHGLWNMVEKLTRRKRIDDLIESRNCAEEVPLTIAIMFDRAQFLDNINRTVFDLKENYKLIFRLAVAYCSTEIVKLLRSNPEALAEGVLEQGELIFLVLEWSPCLECSLRYDPCLKALEDFHNLTLAEKKVKLSKRRFDLLKIVLEPQKSNYSLLNGKDNNGRTPLHIAAGFGFKDAVEYLVELGANETVKDFSGLTPLMLALTKSPVFPLTPNMSYPCYTTSDGLLKSCNTTSYDETLSYLIWTQRSKLSNCDNESNRLLRHVIFKRMPLSLYALLKAGVDINCGIPDECFAGTPFVLHLLVGGPTVSEVIKMFDYLISTECGVPFAFSELHVLSFVTVSESFGNFLKPSINNRDFILRKLIDRQPELLRLFDECYDFEGYLPIHRAAQSANLNLIKWLKNMSVNTQLKTRAGLTALDISILYLGNTTYAQKFDWPDEFPISSASLKNRNETFEELLEIFLTKNNSTFRCGSSMVGLSPLHTAAVKGMDVLTYVHHKVSEIIPGLPLNCTNNHWIDPLYLVHFYESVVNGTTLWESVKTENEPDGALNLNFIRETSEANHERLNIDSRNEVTLFQYPDREAEYHIIYNHFYMSPSKLYVNRIFRKLNANIEKPRPYIRITDCRGFYDLLPNLSGWPTHAHKLKCSELYHAIDVDDLTRKIECSKTKTANFCNVCFRENRFLVEEVANKCWCQSVMVSFQSWFSSRSRESRQVVQFIAERMGWQDLADAGDKHYRWPFYFLYKKVVMKYESYEYLESLNKAFEIADTRYISSNIPYVVLDDTQ